MMLQTQIMKMGRTYRDQDSAERMDNLIKTLSDVRLITVWYREYKVSRFKK